MKRSHGGDWAAYQIESGALPLDFSANVSPLGVPEGVQSAIRAAAGHMDRYPDPLCRALRAGIAEAEGVLPDWVLCGSGASDLIRRVVQAAKPRRVLVTAPCFGEYESASEEAGCRIDRYPLDEGFRLNSGILPAIAEDTGIFFLCQPNNPSGVCVSPALLRDILLRCRETGTRLVLDECFTGFLDEPRRYSLKPLLAESPHLLVLDAFTKLYGMAGVRLGYALCADVGFLEQLRRCAQPWAVSQIAQEAGIAALREREYAGRVRSLISAQRPRLYEALQSLGFFVVRGEANYLLFQSPVPLGEALRKRGILLRSCADFTGLDETWYRAAVRTEAENDRLTRALREVLS